MSFTPRLQQQSRANAEEESLNDARVYVGGISVALSQRGSNRGNANNIGTEVRLLAAQDVRLTHVMQQGVAVYCTTRRNEACRIATRSITDVRRVKHASGDYQPHVLIEYANATTASAAENEKRRMFGGAAAATMPTPSSVSSYNYVTTLCRIFSLDLDLLDDLFGRLLRDMCLCRNNKQQQQQQQRVASAPVPVATPQQFPQHRAVAVSDYGVMSPSPQIPPTATAVLQTPPPQQQTYAVADEFAAAYDTFPETASIQAELLAIQNRRKHRQEAILNYFAPPSSSSSFHQLPNQASSDALSLPSVSGELELCCYCSAYAPKEHVEQCPLRCVRCVGCGTELQFRDLMRHQMQCGALQLRQDKNQQQQQEQVEPQQKEKKEAHKHPFLQPALLDKLRQQQQAQGEVPPKPTTEPTATAESSTAAVPKESNDRLCVWCQLPAAKSHDAKCSERRQLCDSCHQQVKRRDKAAHRATCKGLKRYDKVASSSSFSSGGGRGAGESSSSAASAQRRPSVRFAT